MKKLISIHLLDDRFMVILLRFVRIGIVRTNDSKFTGISIILGLFSIELQINLSKIKKVMLDGYGRA